MQENRDIEMREFKFRVWCKGKSDNPNFNKQKWFDINDIILNKYFPLPHLFNESHDNFVIQQYTGLKDKNDKEIYEGDILEIYLTGPAEVSRPNYGEVVWSNNELRFVLKVIIPTGIVEWGFEYTELKVIGNIYENPELLK